MMVENISYAFVFAAEALIAWLYYDYLFARKKGTATIFVMFGIGYLLLFAVYFLGITALNTVCFFAVNFFLPCYLYFCSPKTAILHSAFLSFVMTIAEVLIGLVMMAFVGDFAAYTYSVHAMIPMAIMSKLLYLLLALIGARVFSPHKFKNEEPRMMVLFCSLPILSALISVLVAYMSLHNNWDQSSEVIIIVSLLALLAVNLIFFLFYNLEEKMNREYLALQLSIQKEKADAAYYDAIQEQMENQRILIHDIRNHLQILGGLAQSSDCTQVSSYIEKLDATLSPMKPTRLCNDSVLNLVLLHYADECRKRGIDFICDIRENVASFMDAPSVTTLYGNLLSNAMESAEQSDEKTVEISVIRNVQQENIVISVINACDAAPIPGKNGIFQTRKANSEFHGIGLEGIQRVVHKYHGENTMYYDRENKRFHHIIRFPTDQNS